MTSFLRAVSAKLEGRASPGGTEEVEGTALALPTCPSLALQGGGVWLPSVPMTLRAVPAQSHFTAQGLMTLCGSGEGGTERGGQGTPRPVFPQITLTPVETLARLGDISPRDLPEGGVPDPWALPSRAVTR